MAAGGKPSTWFPPGRLVEQVSTLTRRRIFDQKYDKEGEQEKLQKLDANRLFMQFKPTRVSQNLFILNIY